MLRAGTNITFDFKVTSQPWFTCEQCNSELQSEGKKVRLMLCVHCAKRCHDGADSASFLAFSELQVVSRHRDAVDAAVRASTRHAVVRRRASRYKILEDVEGGLHVLRVLRLRLDEGGRAEGARGGYCSVE